MVSKSKKSRSRKKKQVRFWDKKSNTLSIIYVVAICIVGIPVGLIVVGYLYGSRYHPPDTKTSTSSTSIPLTETLNAQAKLEQEIIDGKQNKTICLTPAEALKNINVQTCVVYTVGYIVQTREGYIFLNEKQDYKTGFVAPVFNYRASNFEAVKNGLLNKLIAVTGKITSYEGHPQIIIENTNQISTPKLVNCSTKLGCAYRP